MANQLVGLENVPNVYISKITLNDENTESYTATIRLQVVDLEMTKGFIWRSDSTFYNSLKVSLISTSDQRLVDAITGGSLSPHPYELTKPESDYQYEIDTVPISEFVKVKDEIECSYYKALKKSIPWKTKDYTVFALCFIDTKDLSKQFEIDLGGFLKNFSGAVSSEVILRNSEVVPMTSLFLQPNNKVWPGPVHIHAAQYMAGSRHLSTSQPILRRVKVQNLKTIDQRTILYKERKLVGNSNNTIVGPLSWSINSDVNLLGLFSVNIKQFALMKTKHGRTMQSMSPRLFQEFLGTIEINSMSIIRQQVKTVRVGNHLGTPMISTHKVSSYEFVDNTIDNSANNLKNTEKLQQIYLNSDYRIRTYQFKDDEKTSKSKGQYRYKVEMSILDKSQEFLNQIINQMQLEISKLKDLVFRLNRKTSYNYKINRLKAGVETPSGLLGSIRSYCNFLAYTKVLDPVEISYEINQRLMSMTTANYTSLAGEKFIVEYQALSSLFQKKFKINSKYNVTTRPKNNKKSFIPNLIMVSKKFKPIIQFNDYRRYYDYLGTKIDLQSPITMEVLKNRSILESTRFFAEGASRTPKEFDSIDNEVSKAIVDIKEASENFIAPVSFIYDDFYFDLKDLSNVDNEGLSMQFFKSNTTSENQIRPHKTTTKKETGPRRTRANAPRADRKPRRTRKFKKKFSHSFRIPAYSTKTTQTSFVVDSSKYLGTGSAFSNPDGNLETPAVSKYKIAATNLLDTTSLKTSANKFKFDLKAPKSKIGQTIRSKSIKPNKLKRAPVAWKALVCSRSQAAKNEILSTSGDVLQNPETKVTTQMIFQTSQKIEMLTGYRKDRNNNPILSDPIWQQVDYLLVPPAGGLICRLTYTEMPELGIVPDEMFKLPYLDRVFILTNDQVTKNITQIPSSLVDLDINMDSKNRLSKNIKYATTNIVSQNPRKDPLEMRPTTRQRTTAPTTTTGVSIGSTSTTSGGSTGGSY